MSKSTQPHPPAPPRPGASGSQSRRRPVLAALAITGAIVLALTAWAVVARSDRGEGRLADVLVIAHLDVPDVHALLIDPVNPDHVLFGSHAGLQESRDGGFTWTDGTLSGVDAMILSTSPQDPATLYVAGHDVLLVSRDGGQHWQPLTHDLPGTDIHAFAQDPLDPHRLYAFVVGIGVLTSANRGETWTLLPAQPGDGAPLVLATNGQSLYAGMRDGLLVSHDQGTSWEASAGGLPGIPITVAAPAADPQLLYVGTEAGLVKSVDGGQRWAWIGATGTPILAVAAAPSDPRRILMVDEAGAVSRSDDGGETWRSPT
jgi:photosystem II stability/assembly factor-like uncharacterized protein